MRILYLHEFLTEYSALDTAVRKHLRKKLDEMHRAALNEFPHQPLKGAQFRGLFKYRVGDWRLVYQFRNSEVVFITLGRRSGVYR